MKTSMLKSLSLIAVTASFVAACGSGGGGQRIPGGRNNFSIEPSNIVSPEANSTTQCLQPSVVIEVSDGLLCNNPDQLGEALFLVQDGGSRPIEFGPVIKISDNGDTCRLESRPKSWLLPETEYILSTQIDGSGSVIYDNSDARRFTTGSFEDNTACNNAMRIVSRDDGAWQETSLLTENLISISDDGDPSFNFDDAGDLFVDVIGNMLNSIIGLGRINSDYVNEIKFNYQPEMRNITNHIIIRRIHRNFLAQAIADRNFNLFEEVQFRDCDVSDNCMELVETNQGHWVLEVHPDNNGWEQNYVYVFFVVETLQSVDGRYMNATNVQAIAR